MNTLAEDSLITPDTAAPPVRDGSVPSHGTPPGAHPVIPRRRRTGKIASLPLPIRDQINHLIQDGVPYHLIIEKLEAPGSPPLPCAITENNLSDWKDGGHQDWLKDQFWRDEMRARFETFSGLLNGADPIQLPEGGLQLAAIGLCELLRDLSTPGAGGNPDPDKYIRAANSLARLSRSILTLQQYRAACAEAQAKVRELKDPKRKLSEDERRAIILQVDEILGINSSSSTPLNPPAPEATPVVLKSPGSADDQSTVSPAGSLQPPTEPETEIPEIISAELKTTCEPSLNAPVPCDPMQPPSNPSADAQSNADSTIENQNSKIDEHCLECHLLLPALLPTGGRKSYFCPHCAFPLPPAGSCQLPSLEQCPFCKANLPRLNPNGQRPDDRCHHCGNTLPPPPPNPNRDPDSVLP